MYNLHLHPLAKFPGPTLWAASKIPHELAWARGRLNRDLATLHEKYGEVVRVSPNALSFINPDAWQDIFTQKPGLQPFPKAFRRSNKSLVINGGEVILNAGDADHKRLRRILSHGFSDAAIRDNQPFVQTHVALLVQRLRERIHDRATAGKVDLACWLNWTTFDIVGDLAFGKPFGCLEKSEYHRWVAMIFAYVRHATYMAALCQFPWLENVVNFFLSASLMRIIRDHQKLAIESIDRRLASGSSRDDILNIILKHNSTAREMSREEIYSNANIIILAGSETTATALTSCIFFLTRNPHVLDSLKSEICSSFAREEDITFQALSNLTYLTAVLDETMRLHPPSPIAPIRVAPSGGAVVAGHFVPENTAVRFEQWTSGHSKKNFRDPERFDPSRWLNNPRYADDRIDAVNPFSLGSRNCIGKKLAYAEMRLVIARLIYNFEIDLCVESQNWIDHQEVYFIWEHGPLMVQLSERDSAKQSENLSTTEKKQSQRLYQ
ncbi:hypothetical protein MMC07_009452 [Pseudocyphellaria aurata]|nr:hypothetical protein [Pseudocyphellaria aurata]